MKPSKIVLYLRVSTEHQNETQLGLENQRRTILSTFPDAEVIGEFVEVSSGRNDNRPEIYKAAAACKEHKATLVFGDIDRAGRSSNFLFNILPNLGIEYIDASSPLEDANGLMMNIKKVFSVYEGVKIRDRSSKTVTTRRLRGDKLGKVDNFTDKALQQSAATREFQAKQNNNTKLALAVIKLMPNNSNTEIADYLNSFGFKTRNNCEFTHVQVGRIKAMFGVCK